MAASNANGEPSSPPSGPASGTSGAVISATAPARATCTTERFRYQGPNATSSG